LNKPYQRLQEELFRKQAEGKALAAKREIQNTQLTNYQGKLEQLNQIEVKLNPLEQSVIVKSLGGQRIFVGGEVNRQRLLFVNQYIENLLLFRGVSLGFSYELHSESNYLAKHREP
jgi:hypothetical protein